MGRVRQSRVLLPVGYNLTAKTAVLTAATGNRLALYSVTMLNGSGASGSVAPVRKFADNATTWKVFQIDDSETPDAIDVTAAIQAGTVTDIFTTTNNDGFLIQARKQFNLIGLNISTAATGSPVFEFTYFNGTSYVTLPTFEVPDFSGTGTNLIAFAAPHDWAIGTTAAVGGNAAMYSIRVRATTAPTNAPEADECWVGEFLDYVSVVSSGDCIRFDLSHGDATPVEFEPEETLVPYFAGSACPSSLNIITARYAEA